MRRQHVANLLAMMRQYAQQRNVARLAQVAALLLAAQVASHSVLVTARLAGLQAADVPSSADRQAL